METIKITLALVLIFWGIITFSQTNISFSYDNSGNRTERVINMSKSALIPGTFGEKTEKELADEIGEMTVTIYPNPTTGRIKIEIAPFEKNSTGSIGVYDMNGRLVLRQEYLSPEIAVDISNVQNGIYFLKLTFNGRTLEWKIVKQ